MKHKPFDICLLQVGDGVFSQRKFHVRAEAELFPYTKIEGAINFVLCYFKGKTFISKQRIIFPQRVIFLSVIVIKNEIELMRDWIIVYFFVSLLKVSTKNNKNKPYVS